MLAVFFGLPGPIELILFGAVGLLIFGKRLPEVGRSLGKGIVEFKRGLSGIEEDLDNAIEPRVKQIDPPDDVDVDVDDDVEDTGNPGNRSTS